MRRKPKLPNLSGGQGTATKPGGKVKEWSEQRGATCSEERSGASQPVIYSGLEYDAEPASARLDGNYNIGLGDIGD